MFSNGTIGRSAVLTNGKAYRVVNPIDLGRFYRLKTDLVVKECEDGWYQVFEPNGNTKHFLRIAPEYILDNQESLIMQLK